MHMIEHKGALSVNIQCQLLVLNRSSAYYKPNPVSDDVVEIMNEIRSIYEEHPFYGYRRIHQELLTRGYVVNRKRIYRLMNVMGLQGVCPKKRTSQRNLEHAVYPYLLKDLPIDRANQAWAVDITYIKIGVGFGYLVCLIDIYSRRIMGWGLSPFMDSKLCIDALHKALLIAVPDIINSDQGSQFTGNEWVAELSKAGIAISMDGKGRCIDNIYVERLWRSIKYEAVYLHSFESIDQARVTLAKYIEFYNTKRPHQSLRYKTPSTVYSESVANCKQPINHTTIAQDVELTEMEAHSKI
jgi:putative transposase